MAAIAASSSPSSRMTFKRAMENVDIPKQHLNTFVMDFLIQEGYSDAVAAFVKEANIEPRDEADLVKEKERIRDAVYRGDLQHAIEEINEIDPELLDGNKALHFALLRLQLIELIKKMFEGPESEKPRLFGAAVSFAQQNLAPYTPQSEQFKSDLERAMALLIVPREAWQSKPQSSQGSTDHASAFGPLGDLIDPSLKIQVVNEVNAAINKSQGRPDYSSIHRILQTRAWAEELARDRGVSIPNDLNIHVWDVPDDQSANGNNGDTQMTEDADEAGADPIERYTNIESSR